jgi:hypothetical protein
MAVISSGTIGLNGQINGVFGRGASSANYRGTSFYVQSNPSPLTFPSTNLSLQYFYGTAPTYEWNCACDCVGNCAGK